MNNVIAIDPGNNKCGLVLADLDKLIVIAGKIVEKSSVIKLISLWMSNYSVELILLGNGTTSRYWQLELLKINISSFQLVDEARTTLRAKERYLDLCPPRLPLSWLPKTLILPPKNLDAVVALILIEDYFQKKLDWYPPVEVKILP